MYSSVSEAEYQFRRAKAEEEARIAYDRSAPFRNPVPVTAPEETTEASAAPVSTPKASGGLGGLLSRVQEDDVLLLGILFLLFNENKDDDPLIFLILAVLLFS